MTLGTIVIARRFRGPPNSGNGGYSCGRLAAFIDGTAEVTLHKPPPLERELAVVAEQNGAVALYAGERLIATARTAEVTVQAPPPPTFDEAVAATGRTFPAAAHILPMCFVCGPDRRPGDGLRIHCGPLDDRDTAWQHGVAAPWIPGPDMADESGVTGAEFVWASLDCPTAYAFGSAAGFPTILLGRQAVRIERRPMVGERCVVSAWRSGQEGRKYRSEGALFGGDRRAIAFCRATWIEVDLEAELAATL